MLKSLITDEKNCDTAIRVPSLDTLTAKGHMSTSCDVTTSPSGDNCTTERVPKPSLQTNDDPCGPAQILLGKRIFVSLISRHVPDT